MKQKINLKLFVSGDSGNSARAIRHLQEIVVDPSADQVMFEIIDILQLPELAIEHHILATPALVRISPPPAQKIIGDLSKTKQLLSLLGQAGGTE